MRSRRLHSAVSAMSVSWLACGAILLTACAAPVVTRDSGTSDGSRDGDAVSPLDGTMQTDVAPTDVAPTDVPADSTVTCSGATAPAHGAVTAMTASVGDTVTFSCNPGYTLTGMATATCQASGSFTGPAPTCAPNACAPDLAAPSDGTVSVTTGVTGDVATYGCNTGYVLNGDATRTCEASGSWSGAAPTCTLVMTGCTPNPCVHSAACAPVGATGYSCGTCDPGWTGTICDMPVTCTGATAPTNGAVTAASATFGNAVTYSCNAGYTLMGAAMATCQASGTFSGPAPTCAPNACAPNLAPPANGTVTLTMGVTGDVATYGCVAGYILSGSATRMCQTSGAWSGTAPTCAAVMTGCSPNPCVHSAMCMPVGTSGYSCGTCNAGWTGANCDVPVTCSGATAPANGAVSAMTATFGNTVTYSCNAGFTLTGTATATCQSDGTFTGPTPTCAAVICGTPPVVTNASAPVVSGGAGGAATPTFGATATYTCNSGFARSGANPTCTAAGTWGAPPTCVASCGTYTDVVYRTTGRFAVTNTLFGAGDQTFSGLTSNASTPAFQGAGDTTPFSRPPPAGGTTFTNGFVRLRFTNDASGAPAAGTVNLVEWYVPMEFTQTAGANLTANTDHSVGLLAAGPTNCGSGGTACTNHAPTISRPCTTHAQGTLAGTALGWGACTPVPTMMNSWNYTNARAAAGVGCAVGYNAWGNVRCNSGCAFVPAAGLGDSYQTWNQALGAVTFSGTNYATATFTMAPMQIPNGTGQSTTLLSITSSTVITTQCGSTPGTDLVCNIQ